MHHSAPTSSELGFLPAMYAFSGPTSLPEFDLGPPSTAGHRQRATLSSSWETRCLRKHRRRSDDEGCSAKRRRLMFEAESDVSENSNVDNQHDWPSANSFPQQAGAALPQPHTASQPASLSQPSTLTQPDAAPTRPEAENSCMEVEAAQRKLQEIEDRITLEDDSEDEDLDVEPAPRRPVLVISDSLKEGLQRGITDILPHTVAQSVSHSCMELVLWRPLDDPFCRKRKVMLPKPRKPQTVPRQTLTPCPSPTPHCSTSPPSPPADSHPHVYSFPVVHGGEEDMEM